MFFYGAYWTFLPALETLSTCKYRYTMFNIKGVLALAMANQPWGKKQNIYSCVFFGQMFTRQNAE